MLWPIYTVLFLTGITSLTISPFTNRLMGITLSSYSLLTFSILAFESLQIMTIICP